MKPYFSHDEGARNDPKLVEVLMTLGHEGKSVYWDLVEMLYEQGGYLMHSQCKGYAFALRTDCDLIKKLVNDFELFASDGEKFWSETALRRINLRNAKSLKAAESAAKRWSNSERNANALPTQCEGNAIKVKEKKGKEIKETTSIEVDAATAAASQPEKKIEPVQPQSPPVEAPHTRGAADVPTRKARPHAYDPADIHPGLVLPFNTDEFRTLWAGYRQYREENKLPRFNGGMQEQEALRHLGNLALDLHTAQLIISQTIRNGWKNLFKLDEPRPQHSAQNGAAGHGFARPATVHGNPFGIASPQSLAIARAVVMGGADPHFGLDL